MASDPKQAGPKQDPSKRETQSKTCGVCGVKLSTYNPNPNCWQHTIGNPWRGPSAKPRYD